MLAALAGGASGAIAADSTWSASGGGDWSLDTNWTASAPGVSDGGVTTTNADTATFGTSTSAASTITVDANRNIGSINFAGNSRAYTLGGGSLLLSSGGTLQTSGGGSAHTDTVSSTIVLQGNGGTYTFSSDSTTATRVLSISSGITGVSTAGNTTVLTLSGSNTSGSNVLSGILGDGAGGGKLGLTKSGTGSWLISGANTGMSGTVTINGGVLTAQNAVTTNELRALGTGNLVFNGGTLNLRANGSTNNQILAMGNNVTIGNTAVTFDAKRNSGATTGGSFAFNNLSLGTGSLNVTGADGYNVRFTGTTTLTGNATINPTTASLALLGALSDGGSGYSLTKEGAGTLTLSVANNYSGGTVLNNGRIVVGNAASLGTGAFVINGGSLSPSTGTVTLHNNNPITLNGSFTVMSAISTGLSTGTNSVTLGNNITISGGINAYSSMFTIGGVISDGASTYGITLNAAGANPGGLRLMAENTFKGGVTLAGAYLRIGHNQALGTGTLTISGGTISSENSAIVLGGIAGQVWTGGFGVNNGGGAMNFGTSAVTLQGSVKINIDNVGTTVGGVISGEGSSLTYTGTQWANSLTLNGANTFDGGVLVHGGTANATLNAGNATALGTGQVRLTSKTTSRMQLTSSTTIDSLGSAINAPTITTGGTGYAQATTTVSVTGGGGTGATATATVTSGAITGITITDYGTGYTSAPTFTIDGAGSGAVVTGNFAASSVLLGSNTLTLAGTNAAPAAFSGVISGAGNLVKTGSGVQNLTAVNTYAGATSVTGGTLGVGGAGSINASSAISLDGATAALVYDSSVALTKLVTFGSGGGSFIYNENAVGYSGGDLNVSAGALLGGLGKITNNVTLASGGKLSPGNSLGTLTIDGNLDLTGATADNNGALIFRVGVGGDQVVVGGSLDIGTLDWADLDIADNGAMVNGDYVLFDASSPITGSIGTASGSWSFFTGTLSIDNANNDVVLTVVPEPAGLSLVGLAGAGLLARRRRQAH